MGAIYKMCLPLVPLRTREKMRIFDWKAETWKAELRNELQPPDRDKLPEFLVRDGDDAFAEASPRGGLVPVGVEIPARARSSLPVGKVEEVHASPRHLEHSSPVHQGALSWRGSLSTSTIMVLLVLGAALT